MSGGDDSKSPGGAGEAAAAEIGQLLSQARQRRTLGQAEVARELHLTLRQVQVLEAGEFSRFQSMVFVKGYLRAYARLVKLDATQLLNLLDQAYPEPAPTIRTAARLPAGLRMDAPGQRLTGRWAPLAGLVGLLVVGGILFNRAVLLGTLEGIDSPFGEVAIPVAGSPPAGAVLPAAPEPGPDPMPPAAMGAAVEPLVEPVPPAGAEAANPVPSPMPTPSPALPSSPLAPVADQPTGLPEEPGADMPPADLEKPLLHMEFAGDCWVQVKDVAGQVLHEQLHHKGDVVDIPADPPVQVWLGQASAVTMHYNGVLAPVPVKPGYQSARFVLEDAAGHDVQE